MQNQKHTKGSVPLCIHFAAYVFTFEYAINSPDTVILISLTSCNSIAAAVLIYEYILFIFSLGHLFNNGQKKSVNNGSNDPFHLLLLLFLRQNKCQSEKYTQQRHVRKWRLHSSVTHVISAIDKKASLIHSAMLLTTFRFVW